jgi:hypothetical protein
LPFFLLDRFPKLKKTNKYKRKQTIFNRHGFFCQDFYFMGIYAKQDFIAALRDTPSGIKEFLTATIPTPPTVNSPTNEAEANIVQGILAYYILEFFRPFGGMMPVELLLRIGQHNSVGEAILFAGLEYRQESDSATSFEVVEPVDGETYAPGDLRVIVRAKSGKLQAATVTVNTQPGDGSAQPFTRLTSDEGQAWFGYLSCSASGDYTIKVEVTIGDPAEEMTAQEATLQFSVGDYTSDDETETEPPDAQAPGGVDAAAFSQKFGELIDAYEMVMLVLKVGAAILAL